MSDCCIAVMPISLMGALSNQTQYVVKIEPNKHKLGPIVKIEPNGHFPRTNYSKLKSTLYKKS